MSVVLAVVAPLNDAAAVVDALLLAAEVERVQDSALAGRYVELATRSATPSTAPPPRRPGPRSRPARP